MGSKLADESDFGHQRVPRLTSNGVVSECDERAHVRGSGASEVDDDVGVFGEDLGATHDLSFESALVDQASRAHPLDLLEDRPRAATTICAP